jgi:hypothetical protein
MPDFDRVKIYHKHQVCLRARWPFLNTKADVFTTRRYVTSGTLGPSLRRHSNTRLKELKNLPNHTPKRALDKMWHISGISHTGVLC